MLPIDEHAKSGVKVYVRLYGDDGALYKASWCEEGQCFSGYGRSFPLSLVTHYLPVPLVENAVEMREALLHVGQCIYLNDYAELALTTDFLIDKLDDALYAIKWPPKQGGEA